MELILIVMVVSGGLFFVDRYTYHSQDYLADASEYRNSIEQILGYGYPDYQEEYGSELDLSEKEYTLLVNGIFAPKQNEDLNKLQYISQDDLAIHFLRSIAFLRRFR